MPNPTTVSPAQYAQAETQFAPFNDYRLWQLEHAQDDNERIRIMSLIPQADRAALMQKAAQAKKMGVLN